MMKDYSAVIFAGGKSSRMGKDKSLLPFGSYATLSQYQQERLKAWFKKVYLSAKENKFDFDCACIEDKKSVSSPLIGLLSILESIEEDEVFVLSVDAPFVDKGTIEKILKNNDVSYDAIVAKSPSGIQPLCGLYKKSILPLIYRQLEENNHKLHTLLEVAKTHYVPFNDDLAFTNLNHPHEYEKALNSLF
jgi:molybdopterin-guanine dinucleotide biosynthesis protein A